MKRAMKHRLSSLLLIIVAMCSGGCGIELAMIGAAASAASQGSAVYKSGKLNVAWMGNFNQVVTAGEIAANDLGLLIVSTTGNAEGGHWETKLRTRDGDKIEIRTTRKTPQLIQFQIDVGWFGQESVARLVLKRMAVAIRLDANADGSGEVILPLLPAPLAPELAPALAVPVDETSPEAGDPEPSDADEPALYRNPREDRPDPRGDTGQSEVDADGGADR